MRVHGSGSRGTKHPWDRGLAGEKNMCAVLYSFLTADEIITPGMFYFVSQLGNPWVSPGMRVGTGVPISLRTGGFLPHERQPRQGFAGVPGPPERHLDSFQTGSGQMGSSQKCRDSP